MRHCKGSAGKNTSREKGGGETREAKKSLACLTILDITKEAGEQTECILENINIYPIIVKYSCKLLQKMS